MNEQGERTHYQLHRGDVCVNTRESPTPTPEPSTPVTTYCIPHHHSSRLVHHVITDNPTTTTNDYHYHQSLKQHNSTFFILYFFLMNSDLLCYCFFLVKVCIFIICDFVCCSDLLDKEKPTFRYQPVEVILDKFVTVTYHHHHYYYYYYYYCNRSDDS